MLHRGNKESKSWLCSVLMARVLWGPGITILSPRADGITAQHSLITPHLVGIYCFSKNSLPTAVVLASAVCGSWVVCHLSTDIQSHNLWR